MILRTNVQGMSLPSVRQVVSVQEILTARELVREIYMDEKLNNTFSILFLQQETRNTNWKIKTID
jgi:hypothetical protein